MRKSVVFALCLLGSAPVVSGYIWAWMLSLPYQGSQEVSARTGSISQAHERTSNIPCDQDQSCEQTDFCDKHFGVCVPLRREASLCRRDAQCSEGLNCMYGQCHPIIPHRQEGARCKLDTDCGPALCCARHHGEMICKRKLSMREDCYVPDGGLAYSINQVCPCEEGLVCRNGERTREKEFDYWAETETWQCLMPSS